MISMNYEWMMSGFFRVLRGISWYISISWIIMVYLHFGKAPDPHVRQSVLHLHGTMIWPCDGQVKQIVGGTLKEDSDSLITNFEATQCRSQGHLLRVHEVVSSFVEIRLMNPSIVIELWCIHLFIYMYNFKMIIISLDRYYVKLWYVSIHNMYSRHGLLADC